MTGQSRRIVGVISALQARLWLMWAAIALIVILAGTGLLRLRFDDELIRFFDSDIAAFDDYVALARAFEDDTNDVIVLVEAADVADPGVAAALSDFVLDAQFIPGVRAVISPLSLRVDGPGGPEPLFPYPPLSQAEMAARLGAAWADTPALSGLMAADRTALIVILPITEADVGMGGRRAQIDAIAALGEAAAAASGAEVRLSGYPVLRDTIARALVRDIVVLNSIGILVGFLIAAATFKSFRLALLTLPGPIMGATLTMGLHGHLGVTVNTITIALPVLVLVLGTSDAVHIGFERARQGGRDPVRAAVRATRRVAVACLFAAITTAIAFGALAFSHSAVIAEMGRMGMIVTISASLTVLLTQTVVLGTAGRFAWFRPLYDKLHGNPPSVLRLERLPALAFAAPRSVTWGGLALLAVATLLYSQAGPRYSLMDSLRESSPVREVFQRVEQKVAPASQIQVPVVSTDPEVVGRVAALAAEVTGARAVQSIAGIDGGVAAAETDLPDPITRRLVSKDGTTALVSAPFAYVNGEQTLELADRLDTWLAETPGLEGIEVGRATGLPVMSARVAEVVLDEINRSLLIAVAGVGLLIYAWLGNLRVALISLLPNMLPVTLIGAFLTLSGRGIQFSNGLALTVAFGIAVDDTLHVLNRLNLTGGVNEISRERLKTALGEVAPALVTTSTVLILGMGGTLFAQNREVADFGKIAMAVYALALIADLVMLPAILARFGPGAYLRRTKGSR